MTGFYSDSDICWNCKYFNCQFVKHKGKKINNQWDYHRQYMCKKRKVSFWNSSDMGNCEHFHRGINKARTNYGCVDGNGRDFRYTPLGGYGLSV